MMLSDRIIREAAERYPTPLYIFNTDALLERFQYFRKHLVHENQSVSHRGIPSGNPAN